MTAPVAQRRRFWIVFVIVVLLIAGGVSYLASAQPDGLDSATLRGCEVIENPGVDGGEELTGSCIAQRATPHALGASPLADYTLAGNESAGGVAGVIGALVTLMVAGAVFRVIARRKRGS